VRALATSGLVELEPNRGAMVPVPQVADVIEIYAARRALGAVLVRRATRWAPGDLDLVEGALEDLLEAGRSGDAQLTGDADLRFQDALAQATGMHRIPPLFAALTAQLRLHIAVMGLNYTYAIEDMCRDDTELLRHVRTRDEAAALDTWHRKIDEALASMTLQLGRRRAPMDERGRSAGER
jgi:DNA-binding GntR family transcriptional regulator